MSGRARRQACILDLLRQGPIESQERLSELLAARGIPATQATLSRDLRELGTVKGPKGYELPQDTERRRASTSLDRSLQAFLVSAEATGVLVVLRTGPGHAQVIAVELDRTPLPNTLGAIAGDDTIFVATTGIKEALDLAARLRTIAGLSRT